ncbi:hypothetical protein TSOC_004443 [Tetrabaena socialis]|uniref:Uncharacterized protein n=1 Tax=Tetrabaena socialis TaxID=47790 RepID=A0A2J8A8X2_9CHLO|nr:hypothetical protein TSOC_004443 [Tetrabaena socialis]|eukprot:PNH08977.1 hypothetical protein TSOC_004443 [Tetrabaena socialis]
MQPTSPNKKLPRLHWSAYKGDIQGILQCITDGCSLHETVSLRNQHGRLVCGDLASWHPEHEPGAGGSTRPPSPGNRSRASPPRSVRSNASPSRSRA